MAQFDKRLIELLGCVEKDWVIKEPIGKQQYTFLVGTKLTNTLSWAEWSNIGFFRVNSYDGQRILKRLNYNQKELLFPVNEMKQLEF